MAIEKIQDEQYGDGLSNNDADTIANRDKPPMEMPKTMRPVLYSFLARWGASKKTYDRIAETFLTDFNVAVDPSEIERIYDQNRNRIVELRKQQRGEIMAMAEPILNKTQMLMKKEVDRAWKDAEKRDALDAALEAGAITSKEHAKAVKRLRILSINDLVKIANHVSPDKPRGYMPELPPPAATPQLPPGNSPEASALASALSEAVQRGDEVEIQRILWQKNPSAQSSATVEGSEKQNQKQPSNSGGTETTE